MAPMSRGRVMKGADADHVEEVEGDGAAEVEGAG